MATIIDDSADVNNARYGLIAMPMMRSSWTIFLVPYPFHRNDDNDLRRGFKYRSPNPSADRVASFFIDTENVHPADKGRTSPSENCNTQVRALGAV